MKRGICTYIVLAIAVFSVIGTTLHYHHSSVVSESNLIYKVTEIEFCCAFAHNQEINTLNHFSDDYVIQPLYFLSFFVQKPHIDSNIYCKISGRAPPIVQFKFLS
jgi:hypothetical protein